MSDATTPQVTDAPLTDAPAPSPFTMLGGTGVVCEGDVCAMPPAAE